MKKLPNSVEVLLQMQGSSEKVGDIIRSDEPPLCGSVSSGKRFDEDIKVTDMLYGCYDAASKREDITEKINAIKARYYEIIQGTRTEPFS